MLALQRVPVGHCNPVTAASHGMGPHLMKSAHTPQQPALTAHSSPAGQSMAEEHPGRGGPASKAHGRAVQRGIPGSEQVQSVQPSPAGQVIPTGQRAPLRRVHDTTVVAHVAGCRNGRPGQVEHAWNSAPSQPHRETRSRVQGSVCGRRFHGVAQPRGPSQIWPAGQSVALRHYGASASCGQPSSVHASSPLLPHEQVLQPSPAGHCAPTGQSPPPGSGHPGGGPTSVVVVTSIDTGPSTTIGVSVATPPSALPSAAGNDRDAPHPVHGCSSQPRGREGHAVTTDSVTRRSGLRHAQKRTPSRAEADSVTRRSRRLRATSPGCHDRPDDTRNQGLEEAPSAGR